MNAQELEILIKDLVALPKESEWVEFKVNNANPQEIGEYISALSNSACYHKKDFAYLVYGIEDATHQLAGTTFRPLSEKKGNQELENWLVTQLNPRIDVNIYEFDFNGLHFAIFKIQATRNTPVSFRGEYYIRVGSYKKRLDDHPEKEREIWRIENTPVFENGIAQDNSSEEDILQLIDYPAFFELLKLPLPDNRKGIIERLLQEKVIIQTPQAYQIKNLGAILFAKDLNQFDPISRKALRVIFYKGTNRIYTIKEQTGGKGYAVGFEGLIKYLDEQLPSNEVIDKALRKRVSLYPLLAIRELVANALIHQDFSIKGSSPMVEVFSNRIEITNPGKPLIDPLRFVDHNPESRNEILARFMRRLNICEERGSGIDKVVFECEYHQLPAPEIIVGDNYTRIILYAHKTLRQMDKQDKVRACYLHACLRYVSGEYMTNQSLRERFGIEEQNYSMASRIISDTIKAGLIKDYDTESKSRKYAKYVPFWF
ncbi:MAG: putative DNA binding domain-containing protein [Lewinellaceae bacterium]|nr:putative DNA binding domain-containing protein [Lewinellaceae bacterium]